MEAVMRLDGIEAAVEKAVRLGIEAVESRARLHIGDVLTIHEAAEVVRVSAQNLTNLAIKGEFPAHKKTGIWLCLRQDVKAWMEQERDRQIARRSPFV